MTRTLRRKHKQIITNQNKMLKFYVDGYRQTQKL